MILAEDITREEFEDIGKRYTNLVQSISKPAKKSENTLEQLDKFRYEEAPEKYCQSDLEKKGQRQIVPLTSKDLQRMVAWKLKHGKFRPQLMKLAISNTEEDVSKISKAAFEMYENNASDIKGAIKKLSELKGIGPATASLLLSVHDAENVLFFGDEVFYWLCCNGQKDKIKYNFKEHEDLMMKFKELVERLGKGVSALDVERVGYVMMKDTGLTVKEAKENGINESDGGLMNKAEKEDKESMLAPPAAKRGKERSAKRKSVAGDETRESRRSKRGKA